MMACKNVKNVETAKVSASLKAKKEIKKNGKKAELKATGDHKASALKAWETIRARKASGYYEKQKKNGKKEVKEKQVKTEKIGKDDFLETDEVNGSLDQLNGKGLDELQKENHKHQQKKTAIEKAMNGKISEVRVVEVGNIIKKAKLDRTGTAVKIICVK